MARLLSESSIWSDCCQNPLYGDCCQNPLYGQTAVKILCMVTAVRILCMVRLLSESSIWSDFYQNPLYGQTAITITWHTPFPVHSDKYINICNGKSVYTCIHQILVFAWPSLLQSSSIRMHVLFVTSKDQVYVTVCVQTSWSLYSSETFWSVSSCWVCSSRVCRDFRSCSHLARCECTMMSICFISSRNSTSQLDNSTLFSGTILQYNNKTSLQPSQLKS